VKEENMLVPASFFPYFATMAGVGAVLFGFVFLVISIVPLRLVDESTPMSQQLKAASAYYAFLNPLLISLLALIPGQQIGVAVLTTSLVGFISTLLMGLSLLRHRAGWRSEIEHGAFILSALVIYGVEIACALLLLRSPGNTSSLDNLTSFFVVSYLFGIARSWELIGIRQFHLSDVFATWRKKMKQSAPGATVLPTPKDSREAEKEAKQGEMAVWWME
jgi:hypothetical protein